MVCKYCNMPVVLVPSAAERAKKFGGKASDYTRIFAEHSHCALNARNAARDGAIAKRTAYNPDGHVLCNERKHGDEHHAPLPDCRQPEPWLNWQDACHG
jgi:hypothetical protein